MNRIDNKKRRFRHRPPPEDEQGAHRDNQTIFIHKSPLALKKVTLETYRNDKLYPKIVRATAELLKESDEISPVAILMKIGNLTPRDYEAWRRGRIPYLERAFRGSLSKANRYLRIIGFHAHDLNMVPSQHTYHQIGTKRTLRFSRSHDQNIEKTYARHFRWNQSQEKKQQLIDRTCT